MADASIALNRFGLGGRPGDDPGTNPKAWLRAQFNRYAPAPQPIAALPGSAQIATELGDYLEQVRLARREAGAMAPVAPSPAAPMPGADTMMAEAPAATAVPARQRSEEAMEIRRMATRQGRDHYVAAIGARAQAAVDSDAPFVERLVHFWANHFAVSADNLETTGLSGSLEFEAIRPHVLGKFGDMLHAVERHPAMLLYLNQAELVGPNSPAGLVAARARRPRKIGLNENLAREILELHTLGVRTGYSQADVTEFARAMTGRTVAGLGRARGESETGRAVFLPRLHEPGARTILGQSWAQPGEAQSEAVLDMLALHPATARHLATKLARHFAGDDPPAALIGRLEAVYQKSGGDLPSVYLALIDAPECWVAGPVKFKSPWEWSVAAWRALGNQQLTPNGVSGLLGQLGQPVWKPGSPAGWDDVAGAWAGPDAVMRRVEAAERMAQRTRDTVDARRRAAELFPGALSPSTVQAIARSESPAQGVALMLVAPEFLRR
ncbi:DUF1800 family protein [Sphingomonas sp. MMS12-HWE2-04]|uniref:DUF1800 domain-containing protein n=1 Tax=Sphingomonas sp. MMS12-HWE2-04 TaxID=3234199 RepID=UPI00384B003E